MFDKVDGCNSFSLLLPIRLPFGPTTADGLLLVERSVDPCCFCCRMWISFVFLNPLPICTTQDTKYLPGFKVTFGKS